MARVAEFLVVHGDEVFVIDAEVETDLEYMTVKKVHIRPKPARFKPELAAR